jgi:hypothetical protein
LRAFDAFACGDVKPRQFWTGEASIRVAGEADLHHVMVQALRFYGPRIGTQEKMNAAAKWVGGAIKDPNWLVLIAPDAVGICHVYWRYGIECRASADILCSDPASAAGPFTAIKMVRMMVTWAKEKGAQGYFRLASDTEADFEPIARRLGGHVTKDRLYDIPL